jgi:hypothetical protein
MPELAEIPAYPLGEGNTCPPDDNHRVRRLYLARLPFKPRLRALEAPVDRPKLNDRK